MNHALLAIGSLISATNFYLSFLRYPLLRARGVPRDAIRHVSGIPLLGSALVALALLLGLEGGLRGVAWLLLLIDTGGLHWFVASMAFAALRGRGQR